MKKLKFSGCRLFIVNGIAGLLFSVSPLVFSQEYFSNMPEGFEVVKPEDIQWVPAAEFAGIEIATLYGNPAEEGFYVIRVKFSAGNMSAPHFHDQTRFVSVVSGTWWVGLSNELSDLHALETGGFMVHPAGSVHFDGSRDEETIVEIRGIGPVLTTGVESSGSR